jgi:hypothetical protein
MELQASLLVLENGYCLPSSTWVASAGRLDRDLGVVIGCLWGNQAVCEMVVDYQGYLEYISLRLALHTQRG